MFRFPLQRVLELRERQERDAAAALAAAQGAADAARRAEQALVDARTELAAAAPSTAATGAAVGALRTTAFLLSRMDDQVRAARAAVDAAAGAVSEREGALHAAYRGRRAIDRLRERRRDAWAAGASAADRQQMDEAALTRFAAAGAARGR